VRENVDIVRGLHEAWNRGEDLIALGLIDEDIEYVNPPDALEPGTRRGREGWNRAVGMIFESYDDAHIEVERILDAGERVVVLARFRVRGRGSGVSMERQQGYVWTLREGRAVRFEWYFGHEQALAAAGLEG
jgi:ketosteroid isomerase-like protein